MKQLLLIAAIALSSDYNAQAAVSCSQYGVELSEMMDAHKAAFAAIPTHTSVEAGIEALQLVGRQNTERLKPFVGNCGWPRGSVEGRQAAGNAFFIARLSDHDLPFQKTVLALLQTAARIGDVSPLHFAFLSDHIAVAEGRAQYYGTQLVVVAACKFNFAPLDDRSQVEARRKELKLQPLDEFISMVNSSADSNGCQAPTAP